VAIWLVLERKQELQTRDLIRDLAQKYSTAERYLPLFTPHATLCGISDLARPARGLPALFNQVDALCRTQMEVSVGLDATGPLFHRDKENYEDTRTNGWSTFLAARLASTDALLRLFTQAEGLFPGFAVKNDPDYAGKDHPIPHLSLMYCLPNRSHGIPRGQLETTMVGPESLLARLPGQFVFTGIAVAIPRSGAWPNILENRDEHWDIIYRNSFHRIAPAGRLHTVMAGGQRGADQAGLRAARRAGLLVGGWCPPGGVVWTNADGTLDKVPAEFNLQPTPLDASPHAPRVARSQRTEWSVRDSQATLFVLDPQKPLIDTNSDQGTDWTLRCAIGYGRPYLLCNPAEPRDAARAVEWILEHEVQTLNVAGPREKITGPAPGPFGTAAEEFIFKVFLRVKGAERYVGTAADPK